jgi:hypothetical protein
MKPSLTVLFATFLLILIATTTGADVANPEPKASPKPPQIVLNTRLALEPDTKGYEARLQIGEKSLRELREALNETGTGPQSISNTQTRTIFAGLSLFLALSFGGVLLARSTANRSQKATAGVLIFAGFMTVAAIITRANAGPPPSFYWRTLPQNLNDGKVTYGPVSVEILPGEEGVKLIVPLKPKSRPTE